MPQRKQGMGVCSVMVISFPSDVFIIAFSIDIMLWRLILGIFVLALNKFQMTKPKLQLKSNFCPLDFELDLTFELCHLLLFTSPINWATTFLNIAIIQQRVNLISSREAFCWRIKGRLSGASRGCPENR